MKTLGLDISLDGINLNKADEGKPKKEVVKLMIEGIILKASENKRGLDEKSRRQYYKIMDAFDALPDDALAIELEDEWMGFIRKSKTDACMMPNKLLQRVEEAIDAVENR